MENRKVVGGWAVERIIQSSCTFLKRTMTERKGILEGRRKGNSFGKCH